MVREAITSDAKAIAHIRVDGWKTAYKGLIPTSFLSTLEYDKEEKKIRDKMEKNDLQFTSNILVYDEDGEVIGYAYHGKALDTSPSNYQGELVALYVSPLHKGRGIGTKLLNEVKNLLINQGYTSMVVWCLKENYPSISFYKHFGGVIKEEREFEIDGISVTEVGLIYELVK